MSERKFKGVPPALAAMSSMMGQSADGRQSGEGVVKGVKYKFLTGIVKEVYSNPSDMMNREAQSEGEPIIDKSTDKPMTNAQLFKTGKGPRTENNQFYPYLPMNSVRALIIDNNNVFKSSSDVLCFPFFPPHFSLPVKPGEYVWLLQENVKGQDIYYWMCRKVGIRQVDDINITHLERTSDVANAISKGVTEAGMTGLVHFDNALNSNVEKGNSFHDIQNFSVAYKEEFTGEPVPRYAKGCGDLVIQGSNNALISLGVEKFSVNEEDTDSDPRKAGEFNPDFLAGQAGVDAVMDHRKPMSPAIDICIGRKLSDITKVKAEPRDSLPFTGDDISVVAASKEHSGGKPENNVLYEHMEINKVAESLKETSSDGENELEFIDHNPLNCMSRIYISNNKLIDDVFFFPSTPETEKSADIDSDDYNKTSSTGESLSSDQSFTDDNNFSSITMYSTNLRMASAATLKIFNHAGNSMISMSPEGDIVLQANGEEGGRIVLEAGGNIRIVPGPGGILKLGDDFGDARSDSLAGALVPVAPTGLAPGPAGTVPTAGPFITSAAGSILTPAGSGQQSTKVIIK